MYGRMVDESLNYGSQANQERAAAQAKADAEASLGSATAAYKSDLASMGINPDDPRYAKELRKMSTAGAGGVASGMTGARDRTSQMGFARMQDTTGLLAGVPSNASSALSSTAATGSNLANMYNQGQQQMSQNVAGAAALEGVAGSMGAGAALGAAMPWLGGAMLVGSALGLFKDGGVVNQRPYMRGGEIDGPGGPKDDLIATEIPEGAFVMPIGVVKKLGRKALEKMNEVEDHSATKKKRSMVKVRVSDDEFIIQPDAVDRIGLAIHYGYEWRR